MGGARPPVMAEGIKRLIDWYADLSVFFEIVLELHNLMWYQKRAKHGDQKRAKQVDHTGGLRCRAGFGPNHKLHIGNLVSTNVRTNSKDPHGPW